MRIASFNVENMFRRAVALNLATWKDGKVILEQFARANSLLQEPVYTVAIKASIVDALEKLGLKKSSESPFVILRENHGHLLKRPPPLRKGSANLQQPSSFWSPGRRLSRTSRRNCSAAARSKLPMVLPRNSRSMRRPGVRRAAASRRPSRYEHSSGTTAPNSPSSCLHRASALAEMSIG